ncbi:hypothetical protein [Streptomyces sp. NPDC005148]
MFSTADRSTRLVGTVCKERGLSLSASNRCGPLHSRGEVTGSAHLGNAVISVSDGRARMITRPRELGQPFSCWSIRELAVSVSGGSALGVRLPRCGGGGTVGHMASRYHGDALLVAGHLQIPVQAELMAGPEAWRGSLRGVPTNRIFDLLDSDELRLCMPNGQERRVRQEAASHAHESEFTIVPISGEGCPPF